MKIFLHKLPGAAISHLEEELIKRHIDYIESRESKELELYPTLEIDGKLLDYKEAIDWVESYE